MDIFNCPRRLMHIKISSIINSLKLVQAPACSVAFSVHSPVSSQQPESPFPSSSPLLVSIISCFISSNGFPSSLSFIPFSFPLSSGSHCSIICHYTSLHPYNGSHYPLVHTVQKFPFILCFIPTMISVWPKSKALGINPSA